MSTWPSDSLPRKSPFGRDPGIVRAYFLSPSDNQYRLVEEVVRKALTEACTIYGITGSLDRAIGSKSPVIIHGEIWDWLYNADLLIFDVTGENGSVMMELGVTAAWRLKPQVIVVQDEEHRKKLPFNLIPARVLRYELTPEGLTQLQHDAREAFLVSISTLPMAEATRHPREEIFPFYYPRHAEHLISSPLCHRYQRPDGGLEFGSPFDFRFSFLLPYTGHQENFNLSAEMSFINVRKLEPYSYWIGVKVLSSGVHMNYGVGTVFYTTGRAKITYLDSNGYYKDPNLENELPELTEGTDRVLFKVNVSGSEFTSQILYQDKMMQKQLDFGTSDIHKPTSGVCLIQAFKCRAVLWSLSIES